MAKKIASLETDLDELIAFCDFRMLLKTKPRMETLRHWRTVGIKKSGGVRVTLESKRVTKGWATTMSAYRRFINAINGE